MVVISSLEFGGAERQIVEICRRLRSDFDFHVVTFTCGGPLESPLREAGANLHLLRRVGTRPRPERFWRAVRFLTSTVRLRRLLREIRPDAIHVYLFETSVVAAAARWPWRRPPLLVSRRSLVEWIARDPIYFPLARWTNRHADLILANSEAVRRDAIAKEGADPGRIRVIYNGVDTERYRPGPPDQALARELGVPEGTAVVGMVANLHRYKGHEDVLDAAAALASRGKNFVLLFVGRDGNASEGVRRRVSELALERRVLFAGERPDPEKILNLFDVFVSASHEEGFSNSILEAMACGRAILATAVGGSVEQIEDGKSGLLIPVRDSEAMARKLELLLSGSELRSRLGRAARERAVSCFSIDLLCGRMAALYQEVGLPRC